jgi:hypothetical protein
LLLYLFPHDDFWNTNILFSHFIEYFCTYDQERSSISESRESLYCLLIIIFYTKIFTTFCNEWIGYLMWDRESSIFPHMVKIVFLLSSQIWSLFCRYAYKYNILLSSLCSFTAFFIFFFAYLIQLSPIQDSHILCFFYLFWCWKSNPGPCMC